MRARPLFRIVDLGYAWSKSSRFDRVSAVKYSDVEVGGHEQETA